MCNKEILSAVVVRWAQPLVVQLMNQNIERLPALANIESKMRSTGWVGSNWHLANDIAPFAEPIANAFVRPFVMNMFANIPDENIPVFAHGVIDAAKRNGTLSVLDGKIVFSADDLSRLGRLVELNLPLDESQTITIKEE